MITSWHFFRTHRKNEMKNRMYTHGQLQSLSEKLANMPIQKQDLIEQKLALKMLTKQIKELHFKKHYEPKEIVLILKENGITTNQREIKALLVKTSKLILKKSGEKTTGEELKETKKNILNTPKKIQPKIYDEIEGKTVNKTTSKNTQKNTQKINTK